MNLNIVITDGYTLNPGDLNWSGIQSLGTVHYYDRTPEDLVISRCWEADIVVTNKTIINSKSINSCSKLRGIAVTATGYNVVDIAAAAAKSIPVCNVPIYGTDSVAQHVFALILETTNHVGRNAESVNAGNWTRANDWCYSVSPIMELAGKTIGVVGFGRIGRKVASVAEAFGMKVIFTDTINYNNDSRFVSIDTLFRESDVVTLHCPLTRENDGFINRELLSQMKKTALLVNTSRGNLINENDLEWALKHSIIRCAALDVLRQEPPSEHYPLIGIQNCLITPHNAWLSREARYRIMETTRENIISILEGRPINVVNS